MYTSITRDKMSSIPPAYDYVEWNTGANKYMPPKVNDRGGKQINLISKQSNRALAIKSPFLMTWGVSDFVDENGVSDGKYKMTLVFPNETDDYRTAATDGLLAKMKDFENQILDDAVANSELWWGEKMSREVVKHMFFPYLKYSKNKDTKKTDLTKPPSVTVKVPLYNGKWSVELYDMEEQLLFPSEDANKIPPDFITKFSRVSCILQCGGIWIGGKGWGVTWKLAQGMVKQRETFSVIGTGKCHIGLSAEDRALLNKPDTTAQELAEADEETEPLPDTAPTSTEVEDSDEEPDADPEPLPVPAPKKVVKKVATPVVEPPAEPAVDAVPKKKVVKKVAVKA